MVYIFIYVCIYTYICYNFFSLVEQMHFHRKIEMRRWDELGNCSYYNNICSSNAIIIFGFSIFIIRFFSCLFSSYLTTTNRIIAFSFQQFTFEWPRTFVVWLQGKSREVLMLFWGRDRRVIKLESRQQLYKSTLIEVFKFSSRLSFLSVYFSCCCC